MTDDLKQTFQLPTYSFPYSKSIVQRKPKTGLMQDCLIVIVLLHWPVNFTLVCVAHSHVWIRADWFLSLQLKLRLDSYKQKRWKLYNRQKWVVHFQIQPTNIQHLLHPTALCMKFDESFYRLSCSRICRQRNLQRGKPPHQSLYCTADGWISSSVIPCWLWNEKWCRLRTSSPFLPAICFLALKQTILLVED